MDISNKTLAYFLVFAVVLTLFGTTLTLNKLNDFQGGITGKATSQAGWAAVNITASADILLINDSVNFGNGVVNSSAGCNNATLHTNGSGINLNNCWVDHTDIDNAITPITEEFILVNDGNLNISINISSGDGSAASFIGGGSGSYPDPWYQFGVRNNETKACEIANLTRGWTNMSSDEWVCKELEYALTKDSLLVHIRVVVPGDATGQKNDTVTFTATAA